MYCCCCVCHQGQICKKAETCLNLYPCVIKYYLISLCFLPSTELPCLKSSRSKYNASTINYLLVVLLVLFFLHFDLRLLSHNYVQDVRHLPVSAELHSYFCPRVSDPNHQHSLVLKIGRGAVILCVKDAALKVTQARQGREVLHGVVTGTHQDSVIRFALTASSLMVHTWTFHHKTFRSFL